MEEDGAQAALGDLRQRGHAVTVAHVLAREELAPPEGPARFRDAETGETREIVVGPEAAAAYARAVEEFCAGWSAFCAAHRIGYRLVLAGEALQEWAEAVC
jgi:hypothetical protein